MKLVILLILLIVFFVNISQLSFGQSDGITTNLAYIEEGNSIQVTGTLYADVKDSGIDVEVRDKDGNLVKIKSANADVNGNFEVLIPLSYKAEIGDYTFTTKSKENALVISVSKTLTLTIPGFDSRMIDSFQFQCKITQNLEDIDCDSLSLPDLENILQNSNGGGCLIATATFGSELAPQVQQLRELRDNTLLQTSSGTSFMAGFNSFYYSFSPTIADMERENPAFKEVVKLTITPLLASLSLLNYVDIDSEAEVLGYGIGLILLNIGMYVTAPIGIGVVLVRVKK